MEWRKYVNEAGELELPTYLYQMINSLMKRSLDYGTLLSDDPKKLRAYKERVKETFKAEWLILAEAFEVFDLITPCLCYGTHTYCEVCRGSRYQINHAISPDLTREIVTFTNTESSELNERLRKGLEKALKEVGGE